MIDLHDLRERPDAYQAACAKKHVAVDIKQFLELDGRVRALKVETETLRAKQNAFNKELPKLSGDAKTQKLAEMKEVAASVKEKGTALQEAEREWQAVQYRLPSIPLDRVPVGKTDADNVEIRTVGAVPSFTFKARDHAELGQLLDIIDIERGVKVAGSRNYFLKGDGARLQRAVLSLALDRLHAKGYTIFDPPVIVKYDSMLGTGYFPGGEEQAYHLDERDPEYHLIGTAEVPVCAYHIDEILDAEALPKRYAGFSPCFRREAGTYGKDTAGIYRVHQFYKVEQVIICRADADESARMHAELLANAEEVMGLLELPYRVVDVCTGDMGLGQVYKNDIETWMPSRNGYGETHSCSSFHDFQARRLGLRYRDGNGRNVYCYTLNNTCIASPRILIPILEIYQNEDGSVTIPDALRQYMGGQSVIVPPK